ncbi:hypothetical protein AV521_13480 [Streptomyces sp. IMTB 2501]|uniref:hypothetical protein n=1 Tax=Streptomyces sp. IMTB 2501 TaxID=1776340 RepID=UPI00096E3A9F|nr:hypothetical protein [Streptomyces sp. IMTB 2501]OLZ71085.1 hypothetical protein AV521_13480 [Streptomyces sp. IMTB 2501]
MTFPAAFLGIAVRMLRTAAGRRALQLALLVGGLFALGFLCGEQAHAADGTPLPAKVTSARPGETGHENPVRVVRTVTERVAAPVRKVGEQSVTPVRDVVTTVSRSLEAAAARAVEKPRTSEPTLPLPDLTQVPDAPVQLASEPQSAAPRPQGHGDATVFAPVGQKQRHAGARAHAHADRSAVGAPAPVAWYGPGAISVPQPVTHTLARHGTAAVGAPGRPAPTGDPDGLLGKQAADGNVSRHGDAYAVALDHRAPLRLTPGITACVDAPRTRERHRDIPVFPG